MTGRTSNDADVAAVRSFSRAHTRTLGVLNEKLLHTPFSLTESRVLYELAQAQRTEAALIRERLGLDSGYLSRILQKLEKSGLVRRVSSPIDARRNDIELTEAGVAASAVLDQRSRAQIREMLDELSPLDRRRLVSSMNTIGSLIGDDDRKSRVVTLRSPAPGDYGWMVEAHGLLYHDEFGWDDSFEALVAQIVGDFGAQHDPARERAWIAEVEGSPAGCIMCVTDPGNPAIARLRILLVTPSARGLGVGTQLVAECVRFARAAGYERLTLWTNDVLSAARRLYEAHDFVLERRESHRSFGKDLVGETWRLELRTGGVTGRRPPAPIRAPVRRRPGLGWPS